MFIFYCNYYYYYQQVFRLLWGNGWYFAPIKVKFDVEGSTKCAGVGVGPKKSYPLLEYKCSTGTSPAPIFSNFQHCIWDDSLKGFQSYGNLNLGCVFTKFLAPPDGKTIRQMWIHFRGSKMVWASCITCQVWWGWYFPWILSMLPSIMTFSDKICSGGIAIMPFKLRNEFEIIGWGRIVFVHLRSILSLHC